MSKYINEPVAGVGVDLIRVNRVAQAYCRRPVHFLRRIFTAREQDALAKRGYPYAALAARFAGKEAVAKALGCGIGPVRWNELEIVQGEKGKPLVRLHGAAAKLAYRQGISGIAVSLTHDGPWAFALAVAYRDGNGNKGRVGASVWYNKT